MALIFFCTGVNKAYSSVFFKLGLGSSWESNINRALGADKQAATAFSTHADIGYQKNISQSDYLEIGSGYEGLVYPEYEDISFNGITFWLGYAKYFTKQSLFFSPRATRRFFGDSSRDGLSINFPLTYDIKLKENLNAYFGYSYLYQRSNQEQFDSDADQWFLGLIYKQGQKIRIGLDYSVQFGEEYFYREYQVTADNLISGKRQRGHLISTFGVNQEVYSEKVKTQTESIFLNYNLSNSSQIQMRFSFLNSKSNNSSFQNEVIQLNYSFFH